MKTLLEDYQRRLATAEKMIKTTNNTGSNNDIMKMERLNTKASAYRTIISELKKVIRIADEKEGGVEKEVYEKIETLCRLYYRYKKTSDDEIREHLKDIRVVKREIQSGGTVTKYYPLNAESMKKIKSSPRLHSLTFNAGKITPRAISGYEEYKTIYYLCKSNSRFFLRPDIGEIFDAIDFHDLLAMKFDAICFLSSYEALPNTDGEHHIMQAILLTNVKVRQKKEKQKAIQELHAI